MIQGRKCITAYYFWLSLYVDHNGATHVFLGIRGKCICHEEKFVIYFTLLLTVQEDSVLMAMPHGSEKSPEKNHNEIRHSLCMPHGRVKIVANYEENDT